MNIQDEQKLIDLYLNGLSAKRVGEKIGYSKNGVLYVLHKYNIDVSNRKYDLRTYSINDNYFNEIDCQEKAYILGLLMADGNVLDNNTVQLTLQKQDKHILEHIKQLLQSNYPLIEVRGGKYYTLRFKSEQIALDLRKYNIIPRKSLVLKPPIIPKDLYRHMVRGYLDGDGSIYLDINANQYSLQFVGTKYVLKDFIEKMNWKHNKLRQAKKNNPYTFRLGYRGNNLVSEMLTQLYKDSTIHLKRKYEKYIHCLELAEEKQKTKKQIWINNLGSYIGNDIKKIQ